MKGNAGLTAGVVALLALVAHLAAPTGRERGSAEQSGSGGKAANGAVQAAAAAPLPYDGPWIATRHFFAPYEPAPPSVAASSSQAVDFTNPESVRKCADETNCRDRLRRYFGLPQSESERADEIKCVLALVPDPVHTRLALFTDHTIEAIGKGATAADWEFATQWLPWNDTADPNEGDPAKKAQERSEIALQEKQPGVLVFRRAAVSASKAYEPDWGPRELLVFMVGETPTAGVNPSQFQIARAYMKALCGPSQDSRPVKIEGPTFSGSFYSLATLILQDRDKLHGKKYQVQSGTAQSSGAANAFLARAGEHVEFHSATGNLADQDRHFREVLQTLGIRPHQAAVLTEDESALGGATLVAASGNGDAAQPVRAFRFPRDISHLRDAYRQVQQAAKPGNVPVPALDFSIKDPSVGEDSVPSYSQTQTPLSQNGMINEITRAIRRDNIRIVSVSATNVLDSLFLAGVLRRQCPNTRLLIQNADLLFVQAEQTQPLDGALFLTSYPLFAESNPWEDRNDMIVFPDTLSEGVFNATVLMLTGEDERLSELADHAWQSVPRPPAWLLILDRRGFMPVRFWPPGTWMPQPRKVSPPGSLSLLSLAFVLIGAGIGYWAWHTPFDAPESVVSWRGFYLFLFLLIVAGMQLAIWLTRPSPMPLLLGAGLPVLIAAKIGFPFALRFLRQPKDWSRKIRNLATGPAVASAIAAGLVLAGILAWWFCCHGEGSRSRLFAFRAGELRFGSSPLWPVVAAAAALLLWCFAHLRRLYFASCEQPEIGPVVDTVLPGCLQSSYTRFGELAGSVLGLLDQRVWFRIAVPILAALLYLFHVQIISKFGAILGSIDGTTYDGLCISLHLLLLGLLLLTCWQIHSLWRSLRNFTTSLSLLPLARAFIQVSRVGGNRPIWVRRIDRQALDIQTNSVLILHDMGLYSAQLLEQKLSLNCLKKWQTEYSNRIEEAGRARQALWHSSDPALSEIWERILKPAWESEPLVGKLDGEASSKPDTQAPKKKEQAPPEQKAKEEKDTPRATERPLTIPGDPGNVADLARTFVALHYSLFVLYGVRQIQNLLWFPSIGFVLLMFSLNSYSFQAPQWIGRYLMVLFAVIAWMVGKCMVEIERDPILSRIAGTTPGELGPTFYLKLARFGALPILGLLAWQFPWISNFLLSSIQPALEALQ